MSSIECKLNSILNLLNNKQKSCANCQYYWHGQEQCNKWQMKPPAKTIVVGCDDWIVEWEDDIPF